MSEESTASQAPGTQSNLHYRVTHEEWCWMFKNLTESEKGVLYYLRTLDPFGDRYQEIGTREIADTLGISQRSVQRAVLKLANLELIDLRITRFKFKVRSRHQCPDRDTDVATATSVSPERTPCRDRPPEPFQGKGSTPSHTLLNYSDLSQTPPPTPKPSESEEALLQFIGQQNKDVRNPRAYAIKCLKDDREYWEREFLKYRESRERISIPPPPSPPEENFKLSLLLHWWSKGQTDRVKDWIAANPDSGLAIGESGPIEVIKP
jgi:hypothetical protein